MVICGADCVLMEPKLAGKSGVGGMKGVVVCLQSVHRHYVQQNMDDIQLWHCLVAWFSRMRCVDTVLHVKG